MFQNVSARELHTGPLATRGIYTIGVDADRGGVYTLYIGCTLADGTIIKPGDLPTPTPQPTTPASSTGSSTTFSGHGFPGLPPVDFSNAVKVHLQNGTNDGTIPISGDTILGYTLAAKKGDVLDLAFTRVSGNLNLGLVVLSPDNKVFYQASLVNTDTMDARFTLTTQGLYTIGIFRIDLIPPDNPQETSFTIQGKLNP